MEKGFAKLVIGLSPCAGWTTRCKNLKPQKWFGIDHHSPPSSQRGKTLSIQMLNYSGPKQSALWDEKHGRASFMTFFWPFALAALSLSQFPGPFLPLLFFSCFLSQEDLSKLHELKDTCTAMLGAYLYLKSCVLILSLLFWLLLLQGIAHTLWHQGLTEFNLGDGCFPFPWNYWL